MCIHNSQRKKPKKKQQAYSTAYIKTGYIKYYSNGTASAVCIDNAQQDLEQIKASSEEYALAFSILYYASVYVYDITVHRARQMRIGCCRDDLCGGKLNRPASQVVIYTANLGVLYFLYIPAGIPYRPGCCPRSVYHIQREERNIQATVLLYRMRYCGSGMQATRCLPTDKVADVYQSPYKVDTTYIKEQPV